MFGINKKKQSVETSQELIQNEEFKNKHRSNEKAFTRVRKLHFSLLLVLMLQKSMKSIQLILNEFTLNFGLESVSNSAYTQARANLKYTAFIELNQKAVVDVMYSDNNIKFYKGMRVLAIDGSKFLLPDTAEITKEFGQISYSNDHPEVKGSHNYAKASVMYDVPNRIAIDSTLAPARAYEVDLAKSHLEHATDNDLLLHDRNYASYSYLATLCKNNKKFVIRCSASSFTPARKMLNGEGPDSQIVTLEPHHSKLKEIQDDNLPEQITVRFVRVQLETGEYEVLVTSLLDETQFPTLDFQEIYHMRWGVEGFYAILKTRLNLENFSGKTVHSVYQDFYSTVYLTGLESILTADIDEKLALQPTKNEQKVNRVVSFNAIKNQAVELLCSNEDSDIVIK
ncbi:MAG: IS4 family transposase, partial [Desulfobacterales bacterium]|nr:IS4 family transposase [Desulfobacterales bacterium]